MWINRMPNDRLEDLIPGVKGTDLQDDNGFESIDLLNPQSTKARMLSLF